MSLTLALALAAANADHSDVFFDVRRADGGAACSASIDVAPVDGTDARAPVVADDADAVVRVADTAKPLHLPAGSFDVRVSCPLEERGALVQYVTVKVPAAGRVRVDVARPAFLQSAATPAHHLYAFDVAGRIIARAENPEDVIAVPSGNVRVSLLQVNRHLDEAKPGFLLPQSSTTILLAPNEHRDIAVPSATGILRVKAPKAKPKRGEELPKQAVLTVQGPRPPFGEHKTGVVALVPLDTDFRVPAGAYLLDGQPIVVNEGNITTAVARMITDSAPH